jgi:hypothetical protein
LAWSVDDEIRRVPYRLPEVLAAIKEGSTVFVVEGEKAADRLWVLGVPATCNAGGAGKWPEVLSAWFTGADVVILPDNDPQKRHSRTGEPQWHDNGKPILPGQEHARLVADRLEGYAKRIRVLELPELGWKDDVYDWLELGHTDDELYELAAKVAVRGDEYDPYRSFFAMHPPGTKLGLVLWRDLGAEKDPHRWLVKDWLTAEEVSILAGKSGSGKTFLAIDEAVSIATGEPFFGRRVERGGVVYQAGEGAKGLLSKRIPAIRQKRRLDGVDVPIAVLPRPINLYSSDEDLNDFIEDVKAAEIAMGIKVRLIVIDTASAATPGADENSAKDVGPILSRLGRISTECRAHVRLVAHMNAAGDKVRGHTSFVANVDQVTVCEAREGLSDAAGRQIREARIQKQKDGDVGHPIRFVLPSIEIGRDEHDDPITSCTCVAPDTGNLSAEQDADRRKAADGMRLTDQGYNFLQALEEAVKIYGVDPPPDCGIRLPYSIQVVQFRYVKELFVARAFGEAEDPAAHEEAVKKALQRHGEKCMRLGLIGKHNSWVYRTDKPLAGRKSTPARSPDNVPAVSPESPGNVSPDATGDAVPAMSPADAPW